jgi:hypothetical protein
VQTVSTQAGQARQRDVRSGWLRAALGGGRALPLCELCQVHDPRFFPAQLGQTQQRVGHVLGRLGLASHELGELRDRLLAPQLQQRLALL